MQLYFSAQFLCHCVFVCFLLFLPLLQARSRESELSKKQKHWIPCVLENDSLCKHRPLPAIYVCVCVWLCGSEEVCFSLLYVCCFFSDLFLYLFMHIFYDFSSSSVFRNHYLPSFIYVHAFTYLPPFFVCLLSLIIIVDFTVISMF